MTRSRAVPRTYLDANRLWVDSRPRAVAQRRFEAPVLHRLGGGVRGGNALEIGTGRRGTGLRLALEVSCEMTARIVDSHPLRAVSYHPADGDRPTPESLAATCREAGLGVVAQETRFAGCWTALVAQKP